MTKDLTKESKEKADILRRLANAGDPTTQIEIGDNGTYIDWDGGHIAVQKKQHFVSLDLTELNDLYAVLDYILQPHDTEVETSDSDDEKLLQILRQRGCPRCRSNRIVIKNPPLDLTAPWFLCEECCSPWFASRSWIMEKAND